MLAILVGAWLRLQGLSAMEFKRDEQEALTLAMRLLDEHPWSSHNPWPAHGMLSSVGVANPPLFTWIVATVWAPTRDPIAVARFVALTNAICLYPLWRWARRRMDEYRAVLTLAVCAVGPFAVIFSRKIWTQDLLLPGVLAVLWGVEWLRSDKPWRGIVLLLLAVLLAGQLHQSGPIALLVLPAAIVGQWLIDRYRGESGFRSGKPSRLEYAGLAVAIGLNLFFWLPYLAYLHQLSRDALAHRGHLDAVSPTLLRNVGAQVSPSNLFYFFWPDQSDFMQSAFRAKLYRGAVLLGAPLFAYGLWGWARAPWRLPVLGLWWAGIIAVFALAKIPTYPFYALILAPLPAVLAAGGFDAPLPRAWMTRLLAAWRLAYVVALLGLTIVTEAWLAGRGGANGDYGVVFAIREAQARAVIDRIDSRPAEHFYELAELRPDEVGARLPCGEVPVEVRWIVHWIAPSHQDIPPNLTLCADWIGPEGRRMYRWQVVRRQ